MCIRDRESAADASTRCPKSACAVFRAAATGARENVEILVKSRLFSLDTTNAHGMGLLEAAKGVAGPQYVNYFKALGVRPSRTWHGVSGRRIDDNGRTFGAPVSLSRQIRAKRWRERQKRSKPRRGR